MDTTVCLGMPSLRLVNMSLSTITEQIVYHCRKEVSHSLVSSQIRSEHIDSSTPCADEIHACAQLLQEHAGGLITIKIVLGGYELFSKFYPFLRTQRSLYSPRVGSISCDDACSRLQERTLRQLGIRTDLDLSKWDLSSIALLGSTRSRAQLSVSQRFKDSCLRQLYAARRLSVSDCCSMSKAERQGRSLLEADCRRCKEILSCSYGWRSSCGECLRSSSWCRQFHL